MTISSNDINVLNETLRAIEEDNEADVNGLLFEIKAWQPILFDWLVHSLNLPGLGQDSVLGIMMAALILIKQDLDRAAQNDEGGIDILPNYNVYPGGLLE